MLSTAHFPGPIHVFVFSHILPVSNIMSWLFISQYSRSISTSFTVSLLLIYTVYIYILYLYDLYVYISVRSISSDIPIVHMSIRSPLNGCNTPVSKQSTDHLSIIWNTMVLARYILFFPFFPMISAILFTGKCSSLYSIPFRQDSISFPHFRSPSDVWRHQSTAPASLHKWLGWWPTARAWVGWTLPNG